MPAWVGGEWEGAPAVLLPQQWRSGTEVGKWPWSAGVSRGLCSSPFSMCLRGKRRASEANRGDGEEINGAAGDHPLTWHNVHTRTALLLCVPQLDPFLSNSV